MKWVAEFRDWLNRTVLYLDFQDSGAELLVGEIRIVFQQNIFVNNVIGWQDQVQAEIKVYNFSFSRVAIDEFVIAAKQWLALPIDALGSTYFSGTWCFGAKADGQFTLEFQRYYSTPSKTDWFMVHVGISTETFSWNKKIHSDHSCLALFVEGLSTHSENQ